MGLRIKLTQDIAEVGLDVLLSRERRQRLDPRSASRNCWTRIVTPTASAFLLQGTPSNNTPDAPSGFSSRDVGQMESYLTEQAANVFRPGDGSNGDALTRRWGSCRTEPSRSPTC